MFWLLRPRGELTWRDALFAALWPAAHSIYGLARGAADDFYPYLFMDPSSTPWPLVIRNMPGLIAVFVVAALLLLAVDRMAARVRSQN